MCSTNKFDISDTATSLLSDFTLLRHCQVLVHEEPQQEVVAVRLRFPQLPERRQKSLAWSGTARYDAAAGRSEYQD